MSPASDRHPEPWPSSMLMNGLEEVRCWLAAILLAVATMVLYGCGHKVAATGECSEASSPDRLSQGLKVDICLDATGSMKGYVADANAKQNLYYFLLTDLGAPVVNAFKNSQVEFFRFGSDLAALPGQDLSVAQKAGFYTEETTRIDVALHKADPSHLTVIVTDLFEQDSDVDLLISGIQDKYLSRGLSCGILGLKTNFRGEIFDVGPNSISFYYSGLRPVYVVALGQLPDVAQYLASLTSHLKSQASDVKLESVIFASRLGKQLNLSSEARVKPATGVAILESLVQPAQGSPPPQFILHAALRREQKLAAGIGSATQATKFHRGRCSTSRLPGSPTIKRSLLMEASWGVLRMSGNTNPARDSYL